MGPVAIAAQDRRLRLHRNWDASQSALYVITGHLVSQKDVTLTAWLAEEQRSLLHRSFPFEAEEELQDCARVGELLAHQKHREVGEGAPSAAACTAGKGAEAGLGLVKGPFAA